MAPSSPLTHAEFQRLRYFPRLDGLRAISVLLVISVHMHMRIWSWLAGSLGVTIFFVLSGFLITTLALREEVSRGAVSLKAFFVRRACRLLPLYYAVLALYCVLILGLGIDGEKREPLLAALPYYLVYLQEVPYFLGIDGVSGTLPFFQTWSLGIEEKFYLVWPFLAFVLLRGKTWKRALACSGLALFFVFTPEAFGKLGNCLYPYYPILVGCLLAFLLHQPSSYAKLALLAGKGATLVVLLVLSAAHFSVPHLDALEHAYPLLVAALLITIACGRASLLSFLENPILRKLGELSYGMYLVHLLCIVAVQRALPQESIAHGVLAFIAASLLSIGVAFVANLAVERPFIRLGRRWSERMLAPADSSGSVRQKQAA